jgi:Arc/MetJ family transcription regulator
MRITIEIDDARLLEARRASRTASKRETIETALRLMVKLHRQKEVALAFGKYRWRGPLSRSRGARRFSGADRPQRAVR